MTYAGLSRGIHFSGTCCTQETEVRHASLLISRVEETEARTVCLCPSVIYEVKIQVGVC
jgi:hypothetical protein